MVEFFTEYGLFLAKAITVLVVLLMLVASITSASQKHQSEDHGEIVICHLNDKVDQQKDQMLEIMLGKELWKAELKQRKKAKKKEKNKPSEVKPKVFVLDFDGDIKASGVEALREEVTAIVSVAQENDEVLLRLDSSGGMVHTYGLASSQLQRLRDRSIKLTISVDKVAASGGYMMASIADQIIAAPFAILGSIGVVMQLPNFHKILKKNDVDIELLTAGEHKRTLTMIGENTDAARAKVKQELEDVHQLFKRLIAEHRPNLDLATVATGETWYGQQAIELQLIDELKTSDDFLLERIALNDVFEVSLQLKKTIPERLGLAAELAVSHSVSRLWQAFQSRPIN